MELKWRDLVWGWLALRVVLCHITGMEGKIDLGTADRDTLIGIIIRQQAIIESLEKRIAHLEGRGKSGGSGADARTEAQS